MLNAKNRQCISRTFFKVRKLSWLVLFIGTLLMSGCHSTSEQAADAPHSQTEPVFPIQVSENHRYFVDQNGQPFFWLGDTGWLLLSKLNQEQAISYLANRKKKGFNVIQVMVIHDLGEKNAYGRTALIDGNLGRPDTTSGDTLNYWQVLDTVVSKANKNHQIIALVPVWGSVVKSGKVSVQQAVTYARFLADRYRDAKNIVWFNGGDVLGTDSAAIWKAIGQTIKTTNPKQLMSFHPRGRTQSSKWFHDASWLDFNCFQSGHRRYDQDNEPGTLQYGEDNYKYVRTDYQKQPIKPTLDAEPSYEDIPEGLHDSLQPRWDAAAIRRYAYWSVFAGAAGFTYGANAVMQFYDPASGVAGAYGVTKGWKEAINDSAAGQMQYLKKLLLSKPYLERVPDTALVLDQGERYDHIAATRGKNYLLLYTYNGRNFTVDLKALDAKRVKIRWYDPKNGQYGKSEEVDAATEFKADPPGEKKDGNDWVLVIDKVS